MFYSLFDLLEEVNVSYVGNWKISNYLVLRFLKEHNTKSLEIGCVKISHIRKMEASEL